MTHPYRSHHCGALSAGEVGQSVRLSGWIHRKRDHGGVLFVDLRDHYGITQIVADGDSPALPILEGLRLESVVTIDGEVKARDAATSTEARELAEKRHQVVEQNYNTASQAVTELEKKVADVKQRQTAGAK